MEQKPVNGQKMNRRWLSVGEAASQAMATSAPWREAQKAGAEYKLVVPSETRVAQESATEAFHTVGEAGLQLEGRLLQPPQPTLEKVRRAGARSRRVRQYLVARQQ